ncbi:hypothetical protein DPMN_143768 [Dreissena polymorpha]|uniref:Uncharacterized protein n=1 Tax=Dreissena polymorpha TaxID=45954 RepID=A0A9D4GGU0_DREPO|nr:hypothetical protein DPMN_143768 [Dreissena polymorpha]
METVKSVSWEESVLGVYGGDNENAPRIGSEPMNIRSLGGHLIHYTTATFLILQLLSLYPSGPSSFNCDLDL